jgi:hypothetical protein
MPREKTWENERLTHQLPSHYLTDAEIHPVCFGRNVDFSYSNQKKRSIYINPFTKVIFFA